MKINDGIKSKQLMGKMIRVVLGDKSVSRFTHSLEHYTVNKDEFAPTWRAFDESIDPKSYTVGFNAVDSEIILEFKEDSASITLIVDVAEGIIYKAD